MIENPIEKRGAYLRIDMTTQLTDQNMFLIETNQSSSVSSAKSRQTGSAEKHQTPPKSEQQQEQKEIAEMGA
jgi:hypothetical protein